MSGASSHCGSNRWASITSRTSRRPSPYTGCRSMPSSQRREVPGDDTEHGRPLRRWRCSWSQARDLPGTSPSMRRLRARRQPRRHRPQQHRLSMRVATQSLAKPSEPADVPAPPRDQGIPVIIVLPFQDLSGGQIASDLGKGIAEEFLSDLATFPELEVISATSSFAYAGQADPGDRAGDGRAIRHRRQHPPRRRQGAYPGPAHQWHQ